MKTPTEQIIGLINLKLALLQEEKELCGEYQTTDEIEETKNLEELKKKFESGEYQIFEKNDFDGE